MKINMFFFLLVGVLLFLSSCKDQVKSHFITEVEQLEITLDSLETIAFDSKTRQDGGIILSVQETIALIKENYELDTLSMEGVEKIDGYQEIEYAMTVNSGNLAKAKQAIPEVKIKLKELKHDIKHGVNSREKYQDFINFEKEKIEDIGEILAYYMKNKKKYENRYDSLYPFIRNFSDSMSGK